MKPPLKPIALLLALTIVVSAAVLAVVTYGRSAQDTTHGSSALAARVTATPSQTTDNAAAAELSEATEAPEATDVPKPTEAPEATELPHAAASDDRDQSEAPEATDVPKPTETPEATELPHAAAPHDRDQADADDAPEQPEATDAPAARAPAVSAAQAQATVLAANPGTSVTEIELDDDDGASVYKMTLNTGTKVKVDAQSGKILSVKPADGDD